LTPGKGWQRRFEDPISLPRGRQLVTLEDAATYVQKLPKVEQQLEEWPRETGPKPAMAVLVERRAQPQSHLSLRRKTCKSGRSLRRGPSSSNA
jgi:hypothetical protein